MKFLISKRLNKFLEEQKILVDKQLGFRKLHSTTHAITDIFSQISNNIDCSRYTCVLLLDLKKAFDIVDHKLLLYKLDRYGIRGNVLDLFQSYLTRRFQYVYVNDSTSNKLEVKCGVPQGSILGSTLFSLYVNDLPKISEFNVRLFADDTVLIMSDRDLQNLNKTANAEVKKIENWLSSNKLTLNHDKTNFMLFTPRKKFLHNFALNMHNKSVNKTSVAKYLGILVNDNLKWNDHIKYLCKKVSQICGLFCYLRHYVRQNTLLKLHNSFVRSHLLYGILTWGSTNNTVLHPLQVLQNKIVRIISNVKTNERITNNSLYKQLKILKIKDMYELEVFKFMHQHQHNKLPNLCNFYFTPTASIHNYNTRSTSHNNLYLSSINSNAAKNAIQFNGVQIWNSLSPEWKNFPFYKFKRFMKDHLISKY